MKALRVNPDYEQELFYGESGHPQVNQSLEFLALFLEAAPLFTSKKYSQAYLDSIEQVTGTKPVLTAEGPFENWWGELKDLELERTLNSKITSTEINQKLGLSENIKIIRTVEDVDLLSEDVIFKNPFGMSGQKFKFFSKEESLATQREWVAKSLPFGPLIREPKKKRVKDFSHYVFPDGRTIAYENLITEHGQYQGTFFPNHLNPQLEELSFYNEVTGWERFREELHLIKVSYASAYGYSVDSFVFEKEGKWLIRSLCEVNARRTMGRVAFELSQKFAKDDPCTLFTIRKAHGHPKPHPKVMVLSPGDTRFDVFFLRAKTVEELRELLAHTHLSVKI